MPTTFLHLSIHKRILLSILLSLLAGFTPCRASSPKTDQVIVLGSDDDGRIVQVTGSQQLALRLPTRPATGSNWSIVPSAREFFQTIGETRFEPSAEHAPGQAGFTWQNLRPRSDGTYTLALELRGPTRKRAVLRRVEFTVVAHGVTSVDARESALGFAYSEKNSQLRASLLADTEDRALGSCFYVGGKPVNLCADGSCTPVKDQGQCGACGAFAGTAVVENTIRKADWVTRDLSEQYIISCGSTSYCDGIVYFGDALDYYKDKYLRSKGELAAGAVYEADFPYSSSKFYINHVKTPCNGPHTHHERIASWDQSGGLFGADDVCVKMLLSQGHFLMTFADASNWSNYQGGVRKGANPAIANHVVTIVGFDDAQGVWILRNSWGGNWGETADGAPRSGGNGGYMRLKYGGDAVGHDIAWVTYPPNVSVKASLIMSAIH
jgi:inhibitor of cysteine peptidase